MKFFKFFPAVFLLAAVIMLSGCASSESADNQIELGDYNYTMYEGKTKIASGVLTVKNITVKTANASSFTGTYTVESTKEFMGLSAMEGEFSGDANYETGKIFMNTNPRIADANVFFNLTVYSSFFQGYWSYTTFRGPTNQGELIITKRN